MAKRKRRLTKWDIADLRNAELAGISKRFIENQRVCLESKEVVCISSFLREQKSNSLKKIIAGCGGEILKKEPKFPTPMQRYSEGSDPKYLKIDHFKFSPENLPTPVKEEKYYECWCGVYDNTLASVAQCAIETYVKNHYAQKPESSWKKDLISINDLLKQIHCEDLIKIQV
jgi:hypothetical protein